MTKRAHSYFINMKRIKPSLVILCVLCVSAVKSPAAEPGKAYLLHLPGIGGHMRIDDLLTSGIAQGGLDAEVQIYDWTAGHAGLLALTSYDRNQIEAQKIADAIVRIARADPGRRIILTGHSGGAGLAVWALEKLPDEVHVDTLLLLAPALSPQYDLSKALGHVTGKLYAFSSTMDPVLGIGTRNFGTMDRIKTDAAGRVGFSMPPRADAALYAKLIGVPYDSTWTRYYNAGDHIGAMMRPFARSILAPLLLTGELPTVSPASQPSTRAAK